MILVTFAVPQEASPFRPMARSRPDIQLCLGGMGAAKTRKIVFPQLESGETRLVLSCGFAGGLDPARPRGSILFETSEIFPEDLRANLQLAGAKPGRFHLASRVACTAREKAQLRLQTQCDAVEMESGLIQERCLQLRIPCATIRVISDDAHESLPLDFNAFTSPTGSLRMGRLLLHLAANPALIPPLLLFNRELSHCASRLAETLRVALADFQLPSH